MRSGNLRAWIAQNPNVWVLVGPLLLSGSVLLPDYFLPAKVLGWLLYGYVLLLPFVLPIRATLIVSLVTICGIVFLTVISYAKVALIRFPLTVLDIKIFLSNPGGLLNALGVAWWLGLVVLVGTLVTWFTVVYTFARKLPGRFPVMPTTWRMSVLRTVIAVLVVVGFLDFVTRFNRQVSLVIENMDSTWTPDGIIGLSRDLGTIGFLAYSVHLERSVIDYIESPSGTSPSEAAIRTSVERHVTFQQTASPMPDIMLVFAESTFDPNQIFRLSAPVKNSLFDPNPHTRLLTPIRVNPVGGGSWISEFESLVGIDSRLFGYAGYYTHVSLAPYVRKSIATHLRDRGYRTTAFYSAEGDFYYARKAFISYGFEKFLDERDLELPRGWTATDEQTSEAVIRRLSSSDVSPFFAFVSLAENHAPHRCEHYADQNEFVTTFVADANFSLNCALNEYIRKTNSTARAVQHLLTFLEKRSTITDRPFVLLVYGDHQPHTFTRTAGQTADFQPFRTEMDERITFLHLMSSVNGGVGDWNGPPPPLTLIPTLLSVFAAMSTADMYLPQNFLQYETCGSDLFAQKNAKGFWGGTSVPVKQEEHCSILDQLVAGYRQSGVFSFH